jgi:hypothetical protein
VLWLTTHALVLLTLVFVTLFAGVVLPAVWSSRAVRRPAASAVLRAILMTIRRRQ